MWHIHKHIKHAKHVICGDIRSFNVLRTTCSFLPVAIVLCHPSHRRRRWRGYSAISSIKVHWNCCHLSIWAMELIAIFSTSEPFLCVCVCVCAKVAAAKAFDVCVCCVQWNCNLHELNGNEENRFTVGTSRKVLLYVVLSYMPFHSLIFLCRLSYMYERMVYIFKWVEN